MSDDHQQGVEFGPLHDHVPGSTFPLSNEALLDRYGDLELRHVEGTDTLRSILGPLSETTYESVADVEAMVLNMLGDEAIGRKAYTDREHDGTGVDYEQESM